MQLFLSSSFSRILSFITLFYFEIWKGGCNPLTPIEEIDLGLQFERYFLYQGTICYLFSWKFYLRSNFRVNILEDGVGINSLKVILFMYVCLFVCLFANIVSLHDKIRSWNCFLNVLWYITKFHLLIFCFLISLCFPATTFDESLNPEIQNGKTWFDLFIVYMFAY